MLVGSFSIDRWSGRSYIGERTLQDCDRTCSRVIKRRSRVAVSSMAAPRLKGII
ncbi:MAG: hypothetical protein O9326_08465 [Microcystis sp. LE19-338.1B]|nr:hypothetical protein [Microcystis sp. LE19-338.1B]MCZ8358136.1 hypothetical protein [Microcystis sp. LE19-388.1G]